jgi:hypothetical protein
MKKFIIILIAVWIFIPLGISLYFFGINDVFGQLTNHLLGFIFFYLASFFLVVYLVFKVFNKILKRNKQVLPKGSGK